MQDAKKRAILFAFLSLIFASIAGVLFLNKTEEIDKRLGEKTTIYVAINNVSPRERLSPDAFTAVEVPVQYVPPTALRSLKGISQYVTVVPLVKGDMLTSHFLRKTTELTNNNSRLVFLGRTDKVMYDQEVDRFDRVDIVVTEKTGGTEPETYVFMRNVPVVVALRDQQKVFQGAGLEVPLDMAVKLIHEQNIAESIRVLKAPNNIQKESTS